MLDHSHIYTEPITDGHTMLTRGQMAKVNPPAGSHVLDVGCGSGVALAEFRHRKVNALGLTPNFQELEICRDLGFEVEHGQQEQLLMVAEKFDGVWARHVLEHSMAPFLALREFHRVLKPGGWLYVEVPSPGTACKHETNPNHYSVLSAFAWECLIERAGFAIERIEQIKLQTQAGPDVYFAVFCRKL